MKVFLALFCMFFTASGNPLNSNCDDHLKSVAKNLLNRIEAVTNNIRVARESTAAAPEKSKEEITSLIESEIQKYSKIVELQEEINELTVRNDLANCRKLFETQVQVSKENLEVKLTDAVKMQLRMNELTFDSTEQDIARISNNLQKNNLDKELVLCKNSNSGECKLTGEYTTVVNQSEMIISNLQNVIKHVVELAYITKITERGLCTESKNISNYLFSKGCIKKAIDVC